MNLIAVTRLTSQFVLFIIGLILACGIGVLGNKFCAIGLSHCTLSSSTATQCYVVCTGLGSFSTCRATVAFGAITVIVSVILMIATFIDIRKGDTHPKKLDYAVSPLSFVLAICFLVTGLILSIGLSKSCKTLDAACGTKIMCEHVSMFGHKFYNNVNAVAISCFVGVVFWLYIGVTSSVRARNLFKQGPIDVGESASVITKDYN